MMYPTGRDAVEITCRVVLFAAISGAVRTEVTNGAAVEALPADTTAKESPAPVEGIVMA
jgi:hypothetical protein